MADRYVEAPIERGEDALVPSLSSDTRDPAVKPEQVELLYQTYASHLIASVRKMFGNGPPDPEDVAHQTFEKLMKRPDLDTIKNLKAFIWRTARNIVADHHRSRDVRGKYDFEVEQIFFPLKDDVLTPEHVLELREQLELVKSIIRKMPEKRRRALILHRIEGLTMTETVRRMGTSRPTVAAHIAKAMTDLSIVFWNRSNEAQP